MMSGSIRVASTQSYDKENHLRPDNEVKPATRNDIDVDALTSTLHLAKPKIQFEHLFLKRTTNDGEPIHTSSETYPRRSAQPLRK